MKLLVATKTVLNDGRVTGKCARVRQISNGNLEIQIVEITADGQLSVHGVQTNSNQSFPSKCRTVFIEAVKAEVSELIVIVSNSLTLAMLEQPVQNAFVDDFEVEICEKPPPFPC